MVYDEEGKPYSVRYPLLAPLLLNEVQEQQSVIAELATRLEAVERQLAAAPP